MAELPSDMRAHNRKVIEDFRANKGAGDRALLLLTTTGARSGLPRTTPMMYVPDGDRLLVIASNAGAPAHPQWYRNLVASPRVTVEVGAEAYEATAVVLAGDEREDRWRMIVERYAFFTEHQAKISRQIPLVALQRTPA
ncbi:MAG TPA: nitroreductase family deazaflavin-dependent oxidoreductase [Pilimelia sp.]|nr:nitroreductase family deazaflavin-dependent oxidoreductase [Pilimelia sp.]